MFKSFIIIIIATLGLFACTIASPLSTVEQWLKLQQTTQFEQAAHLMVQNDLTALTATQSAQWAETVKTDKGIIKNVSVDNSLAMKPDELQVLGVAEGYSVFYTLESEKKGRESLTIPVVKVAGEWKILWSI